MDTHVIILGAALIIIISFFFNRIAQKTNIPSVLMLMLLGFSLKAIIPFNPDELQGEIVLEQAEADPQDQGHEAKEDETVFVPETGETIVQDSSETHGEDSHAEEHDDAVVAHGDDHADGKHATSGGKSNPILELLKILGTVGVILIVLEAALDLHLEKKKLKLIGQASGLAFVLLLVTSGLIALALMAILSMDLLTSLFYAVPLSVMSSAIIIPSVQSLGESKKEFLIFESAMSDILGIIVFYALLDIHHAAEGENVAVALLIKTIITIVLSVVISYGLIILFQYVEGHVKLFVLIATLMALYSLGKLLHLSSLIIILVFGLMLNNKELFFRGRMKRFIDDGEIDAILHEFKPITLETAFVVRTFFFVAFGFSIIPSQLMHWSVPVITLLVLLAIYISRYIGLRTVFLKNINPEFYVAPRGLITVLLFYAIPADMVTDAFAPGILLLTILVTSFVMTYGLIADKRRKGNIFAEEGASGSGAGQVVQDGGGSHGPIITPPPVSPGE